VSAHRASAPTKHRPRNDQWPGRLFDVQERQAINKIVALCEIFGELEKYGISLAIDIFGRANSSFAVFPYLPFSETKIDSSFVQGCASNKGNANVCKSMIQLAHNFGRKAAAVGIEGTCASARFRRKPAPDLIRGRLLVLRQWASRRTI
jgi:EAL domain-containing protein (putative c-di-GMP-specific phosphodiesterase class I)